MANEISITTRLSWTKNGATISGTATSTVTQVGTNAIENVQIIGASSEAIVLGDVTTIGYVMFKNMNASGGADVDIGTTGPVTAGNAQFHLVPGHAVWLPTAQTGWYAISSSGSSDLLVIAIEL